VAGAHSLLAVEALHTDVDIPNPNIVASEDDADDSIVLPWWRNPFNIVAIAIALAVLGGTIGYVIGNNTALEDPTTTDVRFLQDMRVHHEQAVEMSLSYLNNDGTDRALRTVATTILLEQQLEIGRMIQLLRSFGESEVNEEEIAMEWMGDPVPLEEMPGLASEEDVQRLRDATGADADGVFVELMTEHHLGGIHMAEHAVDHAAVADVTTMATQIVRGQTEEVAELTALLGRAQSGG
jgi:uncharacterized protein (DUF305 family)